MRYTPQEQKIADLATPVIQDLGFALVHVKIVGEGRGQNVQIMAENAETRKITLDECAAISRALSPVFEVEDPIEGAYRLEVSSPGIDRPLTREEDFAHYIDFEAKIEIDRPLESGQKKFRGTLKACDDGVIVIDTEQGEAHLPFTHVTKAKLVLNDHLLKATANG